MTAGILKTVQNSVIVASCLCLRYLGALPVCFVESLSCIKTRFVG